MSKPDPISIHSDPLGEVTRKERRNLLVAAVVCSLVSRAGLIPTKVEVLGTEFSQFSPRAFIYVMVAILLYFLVAFIIYGISDYFAWRKRYQEYREGMEIAAHHHDINSEQIETEVFGNMPRAYWIYHRSKWVAFPRIIFEFFLPPVVGIAALISIVI